MSHLSFHFDLSLAATTYIGWRSWWSHARKVSGRPLSPSIAAVSVWPSSAWTSFALSVLLAFSIACAIAWTAT